jgi:hypothetical protein
MSAETRRVVDVDLMARVNARRSDEQLKRLGEIEETNRRAGLAEIEKLAQKRTSPISFVDCRIFGHAWESTEADRNPAIGWYVKLRCTRCNTVRSDIVNRFGQVERRRYEYPDNYKDTDHWARTDWRLQFLRRLG